MENNTDDEQQEEQSNLDTQYNEIINAIITHVFNNNPPPIPESEIDVVVADNTIVLRQVNKKRRRESEDDIEPNKRRCIEYTAENENYIKLFSGEELFFKDEDVIFYPYLLLTDTIEPSKLTRNIIRRIPENIHEKIKYLNKFMVVSPDDSIDDSTKPYIELRNNVFTAFYREYKLRYIFRRFVRIYRNYQINKKYIPDVDPITLSEPVKKVEIYDHIVKTKYIFDARSLTNSISANLLYYHNGFAIPQSPRNPKTNLPFTYGQLISVHDQLLQHGEMRWALSTLRDCNFNKNRWQIYYKNRLSCNAIRNEIFKLDTYEGRELLLDFILSRLDEYDMSPTTYIEKAYEIALIKMPKHYYIEYLKTIAVLHYESNIFGLNKETAIKVACLKAFKKQSKFIREMVEKKYIQ